MTREEVTTRLSRMVIENYCGFSYSVSSVNGLINQIYDDLEARTCESCKHCDEYREGELIQCEYFEQFFPTEIGKCDNWEIR